MSLGIVCVALTSAVVLFRGIIVLRWLVVGSLVASSFFVLLMGLTHVARSGMPDQPDIVLFHSDVKYGDAFQAGLFAAQEVANGAILPLVVLNMCLGILALLPPKSTASSNAVEGRRESP